MRAFIFPGQGSQSVGMGRDLANGSSAAREVFDEVDHALGQPLFRLMSDGPEDELTLTANAQPAIMAHSIAVLRVLEDRTGRTLAEMAGCVAGHSLGEYSALCAAGALDLTTTAKLLRQRGQAMQEAVPVGEGAMAALLGADLDAARALCEAVAEGETCTVANDNDPSQVVISGHAGAIDRALAAARDHGIKRGVKLPVSAPFHCPLMEPAALAMEKALDEATILPPTVPVVANVTAAPTEDVDAIRANLIAQVTGTVRWRESVLRLEKLGAACAVEIGGKVLGPMVRRTAPDSETRSLTSSQDIDDFGNELEG